ncbi:single hybrid motif-containing protein [Mycena leptocephala]|nr:single hybrid motif-containing protein [Mycena leptocephala]
MNSRSISLSSRLVPQPGRRSFHRSSTKRAIMMPALSPFMTQGTVSRWFKREGEAFHAGDILLEIESEYTTMDVEAQNPGIMGKILSPAGTTNVPVEQVIALAAKTPQEIERMKAQVQMPPPPPPPRTPTFQHHHHPHFTNRGIGLEHAKGPMMAPVHRTPSSIDINDTVHSSGAATVRGMVMDHAGLQHTHVPTPSDEPRLPHDVDQAAELRKTIVSTLSRRGSGAKSSCKKCTTTQYFDGLL